MANLLELAKSINVSLSIEEKKLPSPIAKVTGHKRRPWLAIESSDQATQSEDQIHNFTGQNKNRTQEDGMTDELLTKKPNTNLTQTKHKPNTNLTQTKHKLDTTKRHLEKTKHKLNTQLDTEPNTNLTQTKHKPNTKLPFSCIVGIQRKIVLFLFHHSKLSRSKISPELATVHIANTLKIRSGSIKTSLVRLQEKGIIKFISYKDGPGGWSSYEISKDIYAELIYLETEHKLDTNLTQTKHKLNTQLNTQLDTTSPSSSGSINNKTTTTEDQEKFQESSKLPDAWETIDIEPLAHIGFSNKYLFQLYSRNKHAPDDVQESIYAFAYDLAKGAVKQKIKTTPINYFMGTMNKRLYLPYSEDYENPHHKAARLYLEKSKQRKQQVLEIEKELKKEHYAQWLATLSKEEKKILLSDEAKNSPIEAMRTVELRNQHSKNIWPLVRDDFYGEKGLHAPYIAEEEQVTS